VKDGKIVKPEVLNRSVWGMSKMVEGYTSVAQYRASIIRFGLPYAVVTALAFGVTLIGADEIHWFTYLLGWLVSLATLAISLIRPRFWILAPFGALAGSLLVRSATDGLDAGLGPLLMIPAIAVAVYGSRRALFAMVGSIIAIVVLIEIFVNTEPDLSPAWRQDFVLVIMATILAIAIQDLVTRMRADRALAASRGREIEQLNSITRAIATSTHGAQTLCDITIDVTEATGAAIFDLKDTGSLEPIASRNGRSEMLRQVAAGPSLTPRSAIDSGNRVTVTESDDEISLHRLSWDLESVEAVAWEPIFLNGSPVGVLALAYGPGWESSEGGVIPIDLLAAEGAIAIQQNRITEQLEALATTDPLTEIDNRRGWERMIEKTMARAVRQVQPLSVALLDLDHFKQYNDTHGHQAGDRLLTECSYSWQELMRPDDHIARFGGDEFVLTLPDTDLSQALEVVERLREAIPGDATCSAGVAIWRPDEPRDALMKRADEALYLAKANGRNISMAASATDPV